MAPWGISAPSYQIDISLTINEWQDDASVNQDPDEHGGDVPPEALEAPTKILDFEDLTSNLIKGDKGL